MVCLYGVTLGYLEKSLTKQELQEYPIWSWLAHRLTNFIYNLGHADDTGGDGPYIPIEDDASPYAVWFNATLTILKETFDDATPERLYKCCENSPAEEVSLIIYEATPLTLLYAFKHNMQQRAAETEEQYIADVAELYAAEVEAQKASYLGENPADHIAYNENSDNDSLPELIPC